MPGLPALSPARRVGHKGADHVVPGNTTASFDAALALGVDMIEFDVLPDADGVLRLAHDRGHLAGAPTLEEGLEHLRGAAYDGLELDVDLKGVGYEERVVAALRRHGLVERTLISTMEARSLARVRALEPGLRRGLSVPRVHRDWMATPQGRAVLYAAWAQARVRYPRMLARRLRAGEFHAVMAHWSLATERLWRAVREAGGELYVWTVDDAARIAALESLGVTAIITNDPRLFGPTR